MALCQYVNTLKVLCANVQSSTFSGLRDCKTFLFLSRGSQARRWECSDVLFLQSRSLAQLESGREVIEGDGHGNYNLDSYCC